MTASVEHTIVHIEDDAAHWQPLTTLLHTAIGEHLDQISGDALSSLVLVPPDELHKYPAHTKIMWERECGQFIVNYWLVNTVTIDPIRERLQGSHPIFILDVMRPKKDSGLYSTLTATLASISPFVVNQEQQVRLFTAYSQADGVEFPPGAPVMFKKGVETPQLLGFLLERLGFGGP
jgi:hypothetical protein